MKKSALLLVFILIFSQIAFSAVGDISGYIYETDIVAYIENMAIPSYNIGGETVIIAEDLRDYGFLVEWNENSRNLSVYTGRTPENAPQTEIVKSTAPGKIAGYTYETDITANFNGMMLKSYNIGGRTAVSIEDMASTDSSKQMSRDGNLFSYEGRSIAGANAYWNGEARTISLDVIRPGDLPQKNMWEISGDYIKPVAYTIGGLKFENSDETVMENWVTAVLMGNKVFVPLSVYEKYKDSDKIIYNYATTRGSTWNNILPLDSGERQAYWYNGEAFIDFTDKLKYKQSNQ